MRPCSSRPSQGTGHVHHRILSAGGRAKEAVEGCGACGPGCGHGLLDEVTRLPSTQFIGDLAASDAFARSMSAVGAGGGGTDGSLTDA